jgi:hypothetical protein
MKCGRWPILRTRRELELLAQLVLFSLLGPFFGGALLVQAWAPEGQQWQPRVLGVAILVFAGTASGWAILGHSKWTRGIDD